MAKGSEGKPKAPAHLRKETRAWWDETVGRYAMQSHHLKLLLAACESWDLYCQAKAVLDEKGLTYEDRFGQPCTRPEVAILRDAKLAFVRIVRELNLPGEVPNPAQPDLSFEDERANFNLEQ